MLTAAEIREVLTDSRAELKTLDRRRRTLLVVVDACERLLSGQDGEPEVAPLARPFIRHLQEGTVRDRVVAVMTAKNTPMRAAEIAKAIPDAAVVTVRTMLNHLRKDGKVALIGRARGAMWRLRPDAKDPTKPDEWFKMMPKQGIPAEDRDKAVLARLRQGEASTDDLLKVLPDVDDGVAPFVQLARCLDRLVLMRRVEKVALDRYGLRT